MSIDIASIYKAITTIKNPTQLAHEVPEAKQRDYIELLINYVTPDQDPKILLMITKLYIHLVSLGASSEVRDDAFTSMMILKSFSIRQQLSGIQELLFSFYFHLLYSRSLTPDQKNETMLEFAEFGQSTSSSILVLFLCFYFDTQANADYNLFKHKPTDVSHETISHICNAFLHIIQNNIQTLPTLKPDCTSLTLEQVQQRFYNQFVYGSWGLQATPYKTERTQLIIDCLIDCANTDLQSAKKALIKSIDFLHNQHHSAEANDNADYLIALDHDIKLALTKIKPVTFGKLQPQWDKLLKKCTENG